MLPLDDKDTGLTPAMQAPKISSMPYINPKYIKGGVVLLIVLAFLFTASKVASAVKSRQAAKLLKLSIEEKATEAKAELKQDRFDLRACKVQCRGYLLQPAKRRDCLAKCMA